MIELRRYQLEDESTPITEWLRSLRDMQSDIMRAKAYWADWKRRNS